MTTTKKPVTTTTTAPVVDNGKTPAQRLNSAVLDPKATLSAKEEKILLKYLNKIISDDMTNYEKAVACYDYIIKNTVYDYGGWANPVKAVLIPRGGFFQITGGRWIYVVDESGKFAVRRPIKIGRQNPQFYEVTDGLASGEKVIISGYELFGDNEKLILNE